MSVIDKNPIGKDSSEETIKEEINLQFHWYMFSFFVTYFGGLFLPVIILMTFIVVFFIPYVLNVEDFLIIFTDLRSLLVLICTPLVIIGCYLLHLFLIALITRMFWKITENKMPTKDGVIPRNIRSKTLNYYHIRSFLIKTPKYKFTKGAFPWLTNWAYNFIGSNIIGKKSTIEEQICADKFIRVGDNSYIGVNSVLTSHLVEGIFGNVVYFEVKVGDNVTLAGRNNFASGCEIKDNSYLLPNASGGKFYTIKGNNYYFGLPLRKIFKKKVMEYLKISPEDLERNKELEKIQIQSKEEKNKREKEKVSKND